MALSFSPVDKRVVSSERRTITNVTMDDSYPTGGEAVTAANLRLNKVRYARAALSDPASCTVNMAEFKYIPSTGKLLVYDETPAEIANASNLTGVVIAVTAFGY